MVVCHHVYGLGVRLDEGDYAHVNIDEITDRPLAGPQDFPPVGSQVSGTVLGYSGMHQQLRLSLRRRARHDVAVANEESALARDCRWAAR